MLVELKYFLFLIIHCCYFLLNMFGKNEKANLSKAERNKMAKLVSILVKTY